MCEVKQQSRHPYDGPWAWLVLCTATVSNAVYYGLPLSFGVLLPEIRRHFNANKQSVGWIASIALSMATLLGPLAGALINRFGYRKVALLGAILCEVSLTTSSFVERMEVMYFTYGFLYGCGACCNVIVGFLLVTEYFKKWRALAVGMVTGGLGVGPLVYGPCLEMLVSSFGLRWTFRILAAVCLIMMSLLCVYEENVTEESKRKNKSNKSKAGEYKTKIFDCSVWRRPRYIVVVLGSATAIFSKYLPMVHLAQFAQDQGVSTQGSARLYLFLGLGTAISRPASGMLCQLRGVKPAMVFQVTCLLSGVIYILLPSLKTYELLVMFSVVFGLIDGLFMTSLNIVALSVFKCPQKTSSSFGTLMTCVAVAVAAGPPIAGWIADVYKTFTPAFYLAGATCFFATGLLCLLQCFKEENDKLLLDNHVKNVEQFLLVCERETVI